MKEEKVKETWPTLFETKALFKTKALAFFFLEKKSFVFVWYKDVINSCACAFWIFLLFSVFFCVFLIFLGFSSFSYFSIVGFLHLNIQFSCLSLWQRERERKREAWILNKDWQREKVKGVVGSFQLEVGRILLRFWSLRLKRLFT